MEVISKDQAEIEVNEWLKFRDTTAEQKIIARYAIDKMASGIQNGTLIIDPDTKVITQKLKYPFGMEAKITALKFKPTLQVGDIHPKLMGIDPKDQYSKVRAHVSALTGEPDGIILKMDDRDYGYSDAIAVFFIL